MGEGGTEKTEKTEKAAETEPEAEAQPGVTAPETAAGEAAPEAAAAGEETAPEAAPQEPAGEASEGGAETPPPRRAEREPRGSGIVPLLWAALVLAVLIGAAYATVPFWMPYVSAYLPIGRDPFQERFAGLAGRVQALEEKQRTDSLKDLEAERARFSGQVHDLMTRLDELEHALNDVKAKVTAASGSAAETASIDHLTQEVGRLEKDRKALGALQDRIAKLEEAEAKGGAKMAKNLSAAVADISERLGELERSSTPAGEKARAEAVVLAVGQLREAVSRPGSFTSELDALKALIGDNAGMQRAVAMLAPYAVTGVPTLTSLRLRFDAVASDVARAAEGPGDGGWMERTIRRLKSLVAVRRTDGGTGDGVDAILARAEVDLQGANLMEAVDELEKLKGAPAKAATPWLNDARARLAAEKALTMLHVDAVALLKPAKG